MAIKKIFSGVLLTSLLLSTSPLLAQGQPSAPTTPAPAVSAVSAAAANVDIQDFDYPELTVVPLASQRIQWEMTAEKNNKFFTHLPIQISSMMTLVTGILMSSNVDTNKDPEKQSPQAGYIIGGAWLATTVALSMFYTPYDTAHTEISKVPTTNKKNQLIKERFAEEAMDDTAALGTRLTYLSLASNLGASIYMASKAEKESIGQVMGAASALAAFGPLLFKYRWQKVAREQSSYKKKIYGPLSFNTLLLNPFTNTITPGLALTYRF